MLIDCLESSFNNSDGLSFPFKTMESLSVAFNHELGARLKGRTRTHTHTQHTHFCDFSKKGSEKGVLGRRFLCTTSAGRCCPFSQFSGSGV